MLKERLWHLVSKKLAQEATAEELIELEELLRKYPEMAYAIQHIQDLWQLQPLQASESDEAFQKHLNKMQQQGINITPWRPEEAPLEDEPQAKPRLKRFLLAGLAIAAIVATVFLIDPSIFQFLNVQSSESKPVSKRVNLNEISTRYGSRTRVSLPDGSTVWLNAGSKLVYDKEFDSEVREVTLSGEAYFDVAKNAEKPFIIHTGKVDIKVLGTLFNVKSYPDEKVTEASLIHGSIEVTIKNRPHEKIILKPNEKIVVSNEPDQERGSALKPARLQEPIVAIRHLNYEPLDSTIIETSWVENKLIFQDESFRDIALRLERWYGVNIEFDNEEVQDLRFTGTFRHESVQQALSAMKIAGGFSYKINDNNILIY